MFRANFLVRTGHCFVSNLGHHRHYCQRPLRAKLQEKYYIVEVRNDSPETHPATVGPNFQKSSIREVPSRVTREHWGRILSAIEEICLIYRNQMFNKMKKIGIDEKFVSSKKAQGEELLKKASEKTPIKLKEFSMAGQEQLELIKKSENFAKLKKLPSAAINLTKDVATKAQHYWIIFDNSPYKEKLVDILKVCLKYGKKGSLEIIKFYKHVINAPVAKIK